MIRVLIYFSRGIKYLADVREFYFKFDKKCVILATI